MGAGEAGGWAWRLPGGRGTLAGVRLQCPAQIVSGPTQDLCRPAVAVRAPPRIKAPSLLSVLLGKTGPNPQALLASCGQTEEANHGGNGSLLVPGKSLCRGKHRQ